MQGSNVGYPAWFFCSSLPACRQRIVCFSRQSGYFVDFFDDRIFEAGAVQSYVMLPAVGCGVCTYLSAVLSRSSCLCISRWCGVATFPCLPTALMTSAVRLSKFVHKAVGACLLPALRCRLKSLLLHPLCCFVLFCIMDYDPAS